ncbi:hypothetical protein ACP4OV_030122 [Aristida adscensionis]
MESPEARARRRKLEAEVSAMEAIDRVLLRHAKMPRAGTKRRQPEAPTPPPPSWLLTFDQRGAERNASFDRLFEEAMRELGEVPPPPEAAAGDEHPQDMEQG